MICDHPGEAGSVKRVPPSQTCPRKEGKEERQLMGRERGGCGFTHDAALSQHRSLGTWDLHNLERSSG
jgi:hypothetical protein